MTAARSVQGWALWAPPGLVASSADKSWCLSQGRCLTQYIYKAVSRSFGLGSTPEEQSVLGGPGDPWGWASLQGGTPGAPRETPMGSPRGDPPRGRAGSPPQGLPPRTPQTGMVQDLIRMTCVVARLDTRCFIFVMFCDELSGGLAYHQYHTPQKETTIKERQNRPPLRPPPSAV